MKRKKETVRPDRTRDELVAAAGQLVSKKHFLDVLVPRQRITTVALGTINHNSRNLLHTVVLTCGKDDQISVWRMAKLVCHNCKIS